MLLMLLLAIVTLDYPGVDVVELLHTTTTILLVTTITKYQQQ